MPSSQFILAYATRRPLSDQQISVRAEILDKYVRTLHRKPQTVRESSTGPNTGIITWKPASEDIDWPQFISEGEDAAAWVGIPEHDAMAESTPNALQMARETISPSFDVTTYGAPYAALFRSGSRLSIVNDALGLARLFEFDFGEMVVWATRPGLAHIFAGEHVAKHDATWSGMATLGWNLGGHSHIGSGVQLPGNVRIRTTADHGVHRLDSYADWIQEAAVNGSSWEEASDGMVRTMSIGRYFQRKPIADLSGGKDSRLLAAAALTSGVTDTVRTVRSDHGEVETAEELVAAYKGDVTHLVTDVATSSNDTEGRELESHIASMMKGSEGATVPFTALRGPSFSGYVPFVIARFNGHGGEALHGGEYYKAAWKAKLEGRGPEGALERLTAMVSVARATTDEARAQAVEVMQTRIETGQAMGITTAHGLLNYHYSAERMPLWASSSPNRSVITPYYSSGLLKQIGRTFTGDSEFEGFYRRILESLIPEWATIPFYRPQGSSRKATRFFWQTFEWAKLKNFILERVDMSPNFKADGIRQILLDIELGEWTKSAEASLSRFVWEVSVQTVLDDINARVDEVRTNAT